MSVCLLAFACHKLSANFALLQELMSQLSAASKKPGSCSSFSANSTLSTSTDSSLPDIGSSTDSCLSFPVDAEDKDDDWHSANESQSGSSMATCASFAIDIDADDDDYAWRPASAFTLLPFPYLAWLRSGSQGQCHVSEHICFFLSADLVL